MSSKHAILTSQLIMLMRKGSRTCFMMTTLSLSLKSSLVYYYFLVLLLLIIHVSPTQARILQAERGQYAPPPPPPPPRAAPINRLNADVATLCISKPQCIEWLRQQAISSPPPPPPRAAPPIQPISSSYLDRNMTIGSYQIVPRSPPPPPKSATPPGNGYISMVTDYYSIPSISPPPPPKLAPPHRPIAERSPPPLLFDHLASSKR